MNNACIDGAATESTMFMTTQAYANHVGITACGIRRLLLQGTLPYITLGSKRMIHVEQADKILDKMSKESVRNCRA